MLNKKTVAKESYFQFHRNWVNMSKIGFVSFATVMSLLEEDLIKFCCNFFFSNLLCSKPKIVFVLVVVVARDKDDVIRIILHKYVQIYKYHQTLHKYTNITQILQEREPADRPCCPCCSCSACSLNGHHHHQQQQQ